MNITSTKLSTFNKAILQDLESGNNAKVKNALKKLSSKGNESILEPLIEFYTSLNEEDSIRNEIKTVFSQLKSTKALPELIKNLTHPDNRVKELVLFSIWSSNLDAVDAIPSVVDCACKGDFMVALEALTLIENLEGPFNEQDLIESMISINEYLSKEKDDKIELIQSILQTITKFEEQIQI
ncbi:MAG: hypothetical protein P8M12_05040 [Flavobacteriales bacterium]|nr:hypothetical protein [Flavobacteriales bacterium]